jgi:putative membrane protein
MSVPYGRFSPDELILRDELAIERTLLANERTLLAYVRSAVTLVLAGLSFVYVSDAQWFIVVGVACIPTGVAVLVFGAVRFARMRKNINRARTEGGADRPSV